MSGRLVGVGVGPGDPELLTFKGRAALRSADAVFVPVAAADEIGYAERVVRAHVTHGTPLRRLVFALDPDPQARAESWAAAAAAVAATLATGADAAFATIGDPNVYSTFTRLARAVRQRVPDAEIVTVPGITAMQDLAARSGTVLVEGDEQLALLPFTAGEAPLRHALDSFDTVVCYKGGRRLPAVRSILAATGREAHAVYGARLGLEGQDVRGRGDLPTGSAPYLATVIVTRPRQADR
ncbi:MAG: precorrin-2 C(20)-methyltransferase [Actinobacteria bacterium]|nr:precorrin-2 C(20)-methyltransferase [Actinomycetota bacterium]